MGTMVERKIWIADDGKECKSEADMNAHEAALVYGAHVDEYVATLDFGDVKGRADQALRTRARNTVLAYLGWANSNAAVAEAADEQDPLTA